MLLSGVRRKQIILGLMIFTLTAITEAANPPASKTQPVSKIQPGSKTQTAAKKPEPLFPPLEAGSRLFNGNLKDEFYILSEEQKDPPRPMIINSKPLEAGLDSETLLGKEAETVIDENDLVHEESLDASAAQSFVDASIPLAEPPYFAEGLPPENEVKKINADSEYAKEQVTNDSNISKVKSIIRKLTRKIVDKKKHANVKTRMAKAGKMHHGKKRKKALA